MSFEQYQFAGYGYKITDSEDIDYYWGFFDDEEREEIFCDQNIFYHWLGDTVVFIGFKFGNNLSKDKFGFIPVLDFKKPVSEEELYERYNLTAENIEFINS